jgi:hypothetical protein
MAVAPRGKQVVTLPYNFANLAADGEYFVKVQFLLGADMPWAKQGYAQMEEQLAVKAAEGVASVASVATGDVLKAVAEGDIIVVNGKDFTAKFDTKTGSIYSLVYGGKILIAEGNAPKLDAFRAPVCNDNWADYKWFQFGLHNTLKRAKPFKVCASDVRNQSARGINNLTQICDFTRMIGTCFYHRNLMIGSQTKQRLGHTDMVVKVTLSGQHPKFLSQHRRHQFLSGCFAIGSSDLNDRERQLRAVVIRQILKHKQHIAHINHSTVRARHVRIINHGMSTSFFKGLMSK